MKIEKWQMANGKWKMYLAVALVAITVAAAIAYYINVPNNPPGFHLDESSISYNAYLIAQTGRDEHGERWPLFFRAFGEYKNPAYIYLLATLFKVTGPSIAVARFLSATLGVAAALVLGLLAWRVTGRHQAWPLLTLTALLTPWLFELSRLAFEVALFPVALATFLLYLQRVSSKDRWSWKNAAGLAALLALVTYSYSIGRLFGPLLAVGLVLFIKQVHVSSVLRTWLLYSLALLPALLFHRRNPEALTGRFSLITYLDSHASYLDNALAFLRHYAHNLNPWRMLVLGDPDINQLTHVAGFGLVLAVTGLLALLGLWRIMRDKRRDGWWLYIVYGLLVSPVPASLTKEYFHTLRLAPLAIFVLVLSIAAVDWFFEWAGNERRRLAIAAILAALAVPQGAFFLWRFHTDVPSERRLHLLDVDYVPAILEPALAQPSRPIYIADALGIPGYIQAYWHATLRGVPLTDFVRLPSDALPPRDGLTISTEEDCHRCKLLAESSPYLLYISGQEPRPREPLPDSALRAEIRVADAPLVMSAGVKQELKVRVRNAGDRLWLERERTGSKYQVALGNHWLDSSGRVLRNDDGRTTLRSDLAPGEEVEMSLVVNTPQRAGDYVLEIDMLQESVAWFGAKGSQTVRLPVKIE
jgi:4-amino-4-deoxy-L-arabinose transferase-like glycosyltransferase